jgi:hypothetical protein
MEPRPASYNKLTMPAFKCASLIIINAKNEKNVYAHLMKQVHQESACRLENTIFE